MFGVFSPKIAGCPRGGGAGLQGLFLWFGGNLGGFRGASGPCGTFWLLGVQGEVGVLGQKVGSQRAGGTAGVGQEMHGRVNPKYFHLSVPGVSDTATVRKFCAFPSLISPVFANTLKEQSAGAGLALGARQSHISH